MPCNLCKEEAKQYFMFYGYKYCKECYDKISVPHNSVQVRKYLEEKGIK